jgi:hypothetical protein
MKKPILLLITLLLAFLAVRAQPRVHVGITTGINSSFVLDQGLKADPRYVSELTFKTAPVGFGFGIDFTNKFGLHFESIRAAQGQIYQIMDIYDKIVGQRTIDLQCLQIPMLMRFMGGGDQVARMNFQIGPQLSILQSGVETMEYAASVQQIPEGAEIPDGAVQNPDGSYTVPELDPVNLLSSSAENEVQKFKDKEVQLAMGFGVDIDILKHFYLSTNIRASYSFTDLRNEELLEILQAQDLSGVLDRRANVLVGIQLGIHWMIGGNRSYRSKMMNAPENQGR